jgi:hypothetical protein
MDKDIIILVINAIIVPLIMWGLAELSLYLRSKTAAINGTAERELADNILFNAEKFVRTAVAEVQQTFVDNIKATEGWDAAAQKKAFNLAYERSIQLIGQGGYLALSDSLDDVEAWITAQIEASVKRL